MLPQVSADNYQPHSLHGEQRVWGETNCYADVWIELLAALGLEPRAAMAYTLAVDFEGDQWTFFKPPLTDLRQLYGLDVQELNVWRPLIDHAAEHLAAGRLIATEVDAHWLPDTAGTDYRQQHTKTTIVLNALDRTQQRLGYFHNAGYFQLDGDDYAGLFRLVDDAKHPLPLFAEFIRLERVIQRPETELAALSLSLLREHVGQRPTRNPVQRFTARFMHDLATLQELGLPHYHRWAFSNVRQLGAAFDLGAETLRWLASRTRQPGLVESAACFDVIAQDSKALILKLARAVNTRRAFDVQAAFAPMTQAWDDGMRRLTSALDDA